MDLLAQYEALRQGEAAAWWPRDVVRVAGPQAVEFCQGQLSQDVAALPVGGATWSFLLQPQGKVDALVRVVRAADDELVLHTDAGWGERVAERLERYKLRTKVDIEAADDRVLLAAGAGELVPGLPLAERLGAAAEPAPGVQVVAPEVWEAVRIEAGIPRMGAEADERTIPAETGMVPVAVSFTKGCYTGQELVARIDSRGGHVPRPLRGLVIEADLVPPSAATVHVDGSEVGRVTSAARSPGRGPVALAVVRREVEPPAPATIVWAEGREAAQILSLPLVS